MKSPPVYFVIAQVRHNPLLRLNAYVPEIQERMRKAGYPDHKQSKTLVLDIMAGPIDGEPDLQRPEPQALERHLFLNMQGTAGFMVEQGALSFQTTDYDVFETFSEQFIVGLNILHECVTLAYSERLGIRYLDAVAPVGNGDELADYLVPGVMALAGHLPAGVPIGLSVSETHIPLPDASLVSRTIVRSGTLGFPMDLQPQGLRLADRFAKISGVHAIIDTDASQYDRQAFDLPQLRQRLDMLHKKIRMAFDATVTEHALKVWQ